MSTISLQDLVEQFNQAMCHPELANTTAYLIWYYLTIEREDLALRELQVNGHLIPSHYLRWEVATITEALEQYAKSRASG